MSDSEWILLIAYMGAILGVVWRAIFPWLIKQAEAEKNGMVVKFQIKYIYSTIISLVVTIVIVGMALAALPIPDTQSGMFAAFFGAFVFGMIFHDSANKVVEYMLAKIT